MGYIDQILSQVGESVEVEVVESSTVNEWGDVSETTDTETVRGRVEVVRDESEQNEEGEFVSGRLQGFFHTRWSDVVVEGNRISYNGKMYEIVRVEEQRINSSDKHLEVVGEPV